MPDTHDEVFYVIRQIDKASGFTNYGTGHYSNVVPKLYRLTDARRVVRVQRINHAATTFDIVPTTLCFGEPTAD